jgi:hypothetical protein
MRRRALLGGSLARRDVVVVLGVLFSVHILIVEMYCFTENAILLSFGPI